jgi:16S rRNA (cytosine967-C5)-methyltransferase
MTPGARVAAAIEILGDMADGLAAEQALTRWARRSRFAGSKDRAAIRDHVFDVLRCRRTAAHYGQGDTPRALMIGVLHQQGAKLDDLFTGAGHAAAPLSDHERMFPDPPTDQAVAWNLPDWLIPAFVSSLGETAVQVAIALQDRAPVFLRVNSLRTSREQARASLAAEGVDTADNPLCDTALTVIDGARKIRNSNAYLQGHVELQDAASQAVVAALPAGGRVLDYCAGGGGKALAMAADPERKIFAHDIDPRRMADLPGRAERAGAEIKTLTTEQTVQSEKFDVVLCDAPCSGSGAWRRAAEGKWTLSADQLARLNQTQDDILDKAAALTSSGGLLAYATCSVLRAENEDRVEAFLARHPRWSMTYSRRFDLGPDGDGFYTAHLTQD